MNEENRMYKRLYEDALCELRMHASVSADLTLEYAKLAESCTSADHAEEHKLTSGIHARYNERVNASIEKLNNLEDQYER